jgi:hypothetical protein
VLAFAALRGRLATSGLEELAARVADGTLDPFQAAEEVLAQQTAEEVLAQQKDLRLYS